MMKIFRGKRNDGGGWIYWNEFGELTNSTGKIKTYRRDKKNGSAICHYINQIKQFVDKITVEPCSGLKDLYGKLIFGGDILRWIDTDGCEHFVEVGCRDGCFVIHPDSNVPELLSESLELDMEIAGNVYDNPELLEDEDD